MKAILFDTSFWIALFNERDENYELATIAYDDFESLTFAIPWPTMYEFINTRFAKNISKLNAFEDLLRQPKIELIEDSKYKKVALEFFFSDRNKIKLKLSLVDIVLRSIMDDKSIKVDYLATFNKKDFLDVCLDRSIIIIPE